MDIRLIFRNHQWSLAPKGVAWGWVSGGWLAQASRVRDPIPGGSNGMTRCGSSSAFWLYASKPVGGEDRQIRPLSSNPEQRMKGASASIRVSHAGKKSV